MFWKTSLAGVTKWAGVSGKARQPCRSLANQTDPRRRPLRRSVGPRPHSPQRLDAKYGDASLSRAGGGATPFPLEPERSLAMRRPSIRDAIALPGIATASRLSSHRGAARRGGRRAASEVLPPSSDLESEPRPAPPRQAWALRRRTGCAAQARLVGRAARPCRPVGFEKRGLCSPVCTAAPASSGPQPGALPSSGGKLQGKWYH